MKRRKFLIGTGSAAIGGSALVGSGAFSQVDAQRNVTIQVAEDPNAYLGLDGCPDSANRSYTELDGDGHLAVWMNDDNPTDAGGQGINSDSTTWFDRVFQICNQGKEPVCVHIEDDEAWPRVGDDAEGIDGVEPDDRRVEFYLEDDEGLSLIGEENAIPLDVGQCVCVGIVTRSYGLSEGDELLAALDNEIRIVADVDGDCFGEPECPWLTGQYECTTYDEEDDGWVRTGTRLRVLNDGNVGTSYDLAVANDPSDFRDDLFIESETEQTRVVDASFPKNALVVWDGCDEVPPEGEPEEFIRWGDYKNLRGVADLDEWFDRFGTGPGSPSGAPSDFDDDLWASELHIPEFDTEDDPEDRIGPDEVISFENFPDMSQEAEDEGWITCEKHDSNG